MNQKVMLVASLVVSSTTGLICIPVLSRHLAPQTMGGVSILLFMGVFFGVFDVLRPVFTREFSIIYVSERVVSVRTSLAMAAALGAILFFVIAAVSYVFFQKYFGLISIILISSGVLVFCLSTTFWSVLECASKVGLAQLIRATLIATFYIASALLSFEKVDIEIYAFLFFVAQLSIFLLFIVFAWRFFSFSGFGKRAVPIRDILHTLQLNLSKLFVDFPDRLVFAKIFPAPMFAAYAAMYDVAARSNVVPQYINSYFYPKLCLLRSDNELAYANAVRRLLFIALLNFTGLALLAIATSVGADAVFGLYLGGRYAKFGYILPLLLFVAATYSFAFYGQALLRADGRFDDLAKIFNVTAFSGVLLGTAFYYFWGVDGAMLAIVLLKSPGVGIMLYLYKKNYSKRKYISIYMFIFLSLAIACYLPFHNIFSALGVLASVVVISTIINRILVRKDDAGFGAYA